MTNSNYTTEQLEARLGMLAENINAAIENGEPDAEHDAREAYAAALAEYRSR